MIEIVNQDVENRIGEALRIREMRRSELADITGLNRSSISNWINQRYQPKQNAVYLMARALDVSEMWLAGYDTPMERSPEQKKMDELAQLIHKLRSNEKLLSICLNISNLEDDKLDAIKAIVTAMK